MATEISNSSQTSRVYQLGDMIFVMRNCNEHYKEAVEKLLPHISLETKTSREPIEINTGCNKELLALIHHIANLHHKDRCVWIEASTLLAPDGKKVLIAGKAKSGKSTTSMALAAQYQWRIISENLCLIDYESNRLLKFLAPASFDQNGLDALKALDVTPPQTFALEWRKDRVWSATKDLAPIGEFEPKFDLAIWLDREGEPDRAFSATKLAPGEFARKCLTVSNLLKLKGSYDSFLLHSLSGTDCWIIETGELEQRLQAILDACSVMP